MIIGRHIKIFVSILLVIAITIISAEEVHAYSTLGYKMYGAWTNEYYYVSDSIVEYNGSTVNYGTIANSAVYQWNIAIDSAPGHSLDINLSQTYNSSSPSTRVVISPLDRGATGWRGITYFYGYNASSHSWYLISSGVGPNTDYNSGSAIINLYYVHDNPSWKIQNTMMHEMGHIFGLAHATVSGPLMYEFSATYTYLKIPQYDDINGVRSIYE